MIKVLIADDHAVVRRGLAEIISADPGMELVAEAGDSAEAIKQMWESEPDVAVVDISMPGSSGFSVLAEIKATWPELPVLILSMHPEEQYAVRAIKAGASGYLSKGRAPEELVAAIKRVSSGGRYVTETLAEQLAGELAGGHEGEPHESLSDREFEVFTMMASGKTLAGIADGLNISVKTVSTYRSRILEKMGMENNAELMRYAIERGLVE